MCESDMLKSTSEMSHSVGVRERENMKILLEREYNDGFKKIGKIE